LILDALRSDNGNRQAAAKRLGISPRTLRYKLARLRESGFEVREAGPSNMRGGSRPAAMLPR